MANISINKNKVDVEKSSKFHVISSIRGQWIERSMDTSKQVDEYVEWLLFKYLPSNFAGDRDHLNAMQFVRNMILRGEVHSVMVSPGASWGQVQTVISLGDSWKDSDKTIHKVDLLSIFNDKDTATQEYERQKTLNRQRMEHEVASFDGATLANELAKLQTMLANMKKE